MNAAEFFLITSKFLSSTWTTVILKIRLKLEKTAWLCQDDHLLMPFGSNVYSGKCTYVTKSIFAVEYFMEMKLISILVIIQIYNNKFIISL